MLRKIKLYRHLFLSHDKLLRDVFSMFLLHNSDNDPILKTVFWTASIAVDYVWTLFQSYVNVFFSLFVCLSVCLSVCLLLCLRA